WSRPVPHGSAARAVRDRGGPTSGRPRHLKDGLYRATVHTAPAQVAGERVAYRGLVGTRVAPEERGRRNHHAARAVPTLHRVVLDESLLHRVQRLPIRETLDRRDFHSCGLVRGEKTGRDGPTVGDHVAGATLAA